MQPNERQQQQYILCLHTKVHGATSLNVLLGRETAACVYMYQAKESACGRELTQSGPRNRVQGACEFAFLSNFT